MSEKDNRNRPERGDRKAPDKPKGSKGRKDKKVKAERDPEDELDDANDQCVICANKIKYGSITPCNHVTCHLCSLRHRKLFGKMTCLVCRTENDRVIFSKNYSRAFQDFKESSFTKKDEKSAIDYDGNDIFEECEKLDRNDCKICQELFSNFKSLSEHMKSAHNKFYCLICSSNKKVFVMELAIYSYKQLQKHQADGDEKGFDGHPPCKHCKGKRFYSEDELNTHIRDKHERCYICDQNSPRLADYYKNYDDLFKHFCEAHFVCTVPSCLEKKFVVFRDDLELTSHMLKEHGGLLGVNGKVVVGTGTSFQTQLSAFNDAAERRRGSSSRMDMSENNGDSTELKTKRLEERAKHYLNYNTDLLRDFMQTIPQYKSKSITAKDALKKIRSIFNTINKTELGLIVFEFGELFPKKSNLYQGIIDASRELQLSTDDQNFPVLGNSSAKVTSVHGWDRSNLGTSSSQERFPALSKPKKQTPAVTVNQPIRYSKVVRKTVKPASISTMEENLDYKPLYLNNINHSPSPAPSKSLPAISDTKFPALQKKTKKKEIPRVKTVNIDHSQWGSSSRSTDTSDSQEPEIPISDKRKAKQKKKQEKILFAT